MTPTSSAMRPSGATSGDLIALVDSDIVLPRDWMSRAVTALVDSGSSCVAGGMKSVHHSFWGRYTDSTWIGAKTPRITQSYTVTKTNFGARGRKPPITANTLFTRELYEDCPIDPSWSHGSYEDYEWFWRVTTAGYGIFVCRELFGWHDHRRGMRALVKEYRRSSRGCAYFIRAHRDCPFAKRRLRQLFILPLAAIASAAAAAAAVVAGHGMAVAALLLGGISGARSAPDLSLAEPGEHRLPGGWAGPGGGLHHRTRDEPDRIAPRWGKFPRRHPASHVRVRGTRAAHQGTPPVPPDRDLCRAGRPIAHPRLEQHGLPG